MDHLNKKINYKKTPLSLLIVYSIVIVITQLTSKIRPQPDVVALEQVPYGHRHVLEVSGRHRGGLVLAADDTEAVEPKVFRLIRNYKNRQSRWLNFRQ